MPRAPIRWNMNILLACERSGGHIFPALVLAKKLQSRYGSDCKIYFFLTADFLKEAVDKEGYCVVGRSFKKRFLPLEIIYRFFEAIFLIFKLRPKKLIGFGGRDSFFLVLFAALSRVDTAIYEPNVEFGKANKVLARFVPTVFSGFAQPQYPSYKIKVTGIPLRPNLKPQDRHTALKAFDLDDKPTALIFGGSQGSVFLNDLMKRTVNEIRKDFQIVHFTGQRDYLEMRDFYNTIKRKVFVRDFYAAMQVAYSAADVVICRSGALAVAEVCYFKVPAIFVPHPAGGGHQTANALRVAESGGARIFCQKDFSFEKFYTAFEAILFDSALNRDMRNRLARIKLGVEFEDFGRDIVF